MKHWTSVSISLLFSWDGLEPSYAGVFSGFFAEKIEFSLTAEGPGCLHQGRTQGVHGGRLGSFTISALCFRTTKNGFDFVFWNHFVIHAETNCRLYMFVFVLLCWVSTGENYPHITILLKQKITFDEVIKFQNTFTQFKMSL